MRLNGAASDKLWWLGASREDAEDGKAHTLGGGSREITPGCFFVLAGSRGRFGGENKNGVT